MGRKETKQICNIRFGFDVESEVSIACEEVDEVEELGTVNWTEALCATGGAELLPLFFSEEADEITRAKAICGSCPLILPCYEGALRRREPWGVWGGKLFDRGQPLEQKRVRGRPRKSAPVAEPAASQQVEVA